MLANLIEFFLLQDPISRSHKSLLTHPAALVAKVPNTIAPTNAGQPPVGAAKDGPGLES